MKIVSDFKDYYDSAQAFGTDPSITYVRTCESFEYETSVYRDDDRRERMPRHLDRLLQVPLDILKRLPRRLVEKHKWHSNTLEIPITTRLTGFCGYLYPAFEVSGQTFYSTDQFVRDLPESCLERLHLRRKTLEELLNQSFGAWRSPYWGSAPLSHDTWAKVTSELDGKRFDEVFVHLGVPSFKVEYAAGNGRDDLTDKIRCTLNPRLNVDQFQRVKGPAEAFQEISMYVGNQLARQPDPVSAVPDDVLRDEKGFNEWSFRRHKEEDKKLRKKQDRQ
ncbi:MAG: hypothetical protein IT365_28990 [Candidatus Hydrogenedentes bacterium]|nr:hypothetical protein [Candidatus Hydrogenedentota bacterium]